MNAQASPRSVRVAAVQAEPHALTSPLSEFERHLSRVLEQHPHVDLVVYPELHLFGADRDDLNEQNRTLRGSAVPIDGALVADLGDIAARAGVVLVPGSICELGENGEVFNTALVFDRDGTLLETYRKVFPWRPSEPYDPGTSFVVVDVPDMGRLGLSICYDAWFPEVTRHLAWMGAEAVINIVKTTTPDRVQELVLARSNSIVNQTFTVSVNVAGPIGQGRSIIVDPEGVVLAESHQAAADVLVVDIDLAEVDRVRVEGTAGTNRMWSQFREGDPLIPMPLYDGVLRPDRWQPAAPIRPLNA